MNIVSLWCVYFYVRIILSVLHKRILCPSKRNYHGSILRERLSERVAIISKSIKCKNDRRWFPAWLYVVGPTPSCVLLLYFFFFRFQTYKCTLHTKQSLYYICCYLSRIYAIRSLSLSHKYFLLYSYLLPFAHLRTRTQILHTKRSHTVSLTVYHIHFAHLLSKKYPLFTSNAIQLYNNLKKCIIYMYKDSRSHSKR